MHKLLEPQDLRKLDVLTELSLTLEPCNMNELAEKLDVNIKTLLVTVDEINNDALAYHQDIRIERYSRSELQLVVANNFSVFYFKLMYLKNSLLYQFLHSIFNNEYQNMSTIADHNHISVASLYRKVPRLKEVLNAFDLEFDATAEFPIKGSEKQIRYFFFQFYWYSAQMFEWPFSTDLKRLCLRLHDHMFVNASKPTSLVLKEKIILWLAINIIRLDAGYKLTNDDVLEMKCFTDSNRNYQAVKEKLQKHLANIDYTHPVHFEENDFILSYCMLICDEDYINEDDFNFLTFSGTERKIFEEATFIFLNKCSHYLKRSLSNEEHFKLYKNLLRIHMHAYFFVQKALFLSLNQRYDHTKNTYLQCLPGFSNFYHHLFTDEKRFEIFKNNPNLYCRYLVLLRDNLDEETFYPEIKIALFILESKNIENYYRTKIQSLTQSKVHFVEEIIDIEDANLLISYIPLDLGSDFNYFIINVPPTSWDWERLRLELNRIQADLRLTQNLSIDSVSSGNVSVK